MRLLNCCGEIEVKQLRGNHFEKAKILLPLYQVVVRKSSMGQFKAEMESNGEGGGALITYLSKAIIHHLDGNREKARKYANQATEMYRKEKHLYVSIGEILREKGEVV